jgi:hypothetical protein
MVPTSTYPDPDPTGRINSFCSGLLAVFLRFQPFISSQRASLCFTLQGMKIQPFIGFPVMSKTFTCSWKGQLVSGDRCARSGSPTHAAKAFLAFRNPSPNIFPISKLVKAMSTAVPGFH